MLTGPLLLLFNISITVPFEDYDILKSQEAAVRPDRLGVSCRNLSTIDVANSTACCLSDDFLITLFK
jgi:hypothetical protein